MKLTIPYPEYLYESNNYLVQILETVCDAGVLLDQSLNIVYCSKKAFPHLSTQYQKDQIIGTGIEKYDRQSPFRQVLETGKPVKGFILKNALGKTNISHIFPIYVDTSITGILCVLAFDDLNYIKHILTHVNNQNELKLSKELYNKISQMESRYTFDNYIGDSPIVRQMIESGKKAAMTNYPVLISGETGTGKEIIAHSIHAASSANFLVPFVRINCTAIPAALLESELFGHEKGAFTGAAATKQGKFELAANGTILLDEIEAMELSLQGKLLRVLEEREFERVGGHQLIPLNARIIASSNQNLKELVAQGSFRADLYYRLNVIEIKLPALREHPADIMLLIDYFKTRNNFTFHLTADAEALLLSYAWPGNVRELRNLMVKLSIIDIKDSLIDRTTLSKILDITTPPEIISSLPENSFPAGSADEYLQITQLLKYYHYNIRHTADHLGISRPTLYKKIKKYNIPLHRF